MKLINLAIRENNDVEYLKLLEEYKNTLKNHPLLIVAITETVLIMVILIQGDGLKNPSKS